MKSAASLTLTALAMALCSCSTNPTRMAGEPSITSGDRPPVTLTELSTLRQQPNLKFEKVRVSMKVAPEAKGREITLGDVTALRGQRVQVAQVKEFPYPVDFDFAKPAKGGPYPVTPTTPRGFASRNTGVTVEFTATAKGAFIILDGRVTDSRCERLSCNSGRIFSPVYTDDKKVVLTDNKCVSPQFTDRTTHFHVAALPNQTLSIPMNAAEQGTSLQITATIPDTSGSAVVKRSPARQKPETALTLASGG